MTTPPELRIIGLIHTPYATISDCPRQPWHQEALATIELHPDYQQAADGLATGLLLHVLWWAGQATRDLLRRRPTPDAAPQGVLAGRGVDRPNPIGLTLTEIITAAPARLTVRGMDCANGTPLLDLKPAIALPGRPHTQ